VNRREFMTLLGGAAAAWPRGAWAQQATKIPRINIIDDAPRLRDLGYLEGQNIKADPWMIRLRQRRPPLVVAVALANETARIVLAVMLRESEYQPRGAPS